MPPPLTGDANLNGILDKVLDFLSSKSLKETKATLVNEIQRLYGPLTEGGSTTINQYTSALERVMEACRNMMLEPSFDGNDVNSDEVDEWAEQSRTPINDLAYQEPLPLFERLKMSESAEQPLRQRRGTGTARDAIVFHPAIAMSQAEEQTLVQVLQAKAQTSTDTSSVAPANGGIALVWTNR